MQKNQKIQKMQRKNTRKQLKMQDKARFKKMQLNANKNKKFQNA